MKSMPASSAICARRLRSRQLPDQRSGTKVTARPDEQFAPNRPICSLLSEYMARRDCREACGACTGVTFFLLPLPLVGRGRGGGGGGAGASVLFLFPPPPRGGGGGGGGGVREVYKSVEALTPPPDPPPYPP